MPAFAWTPRRGRAHQRRCCDRGWVAVRAAGRARGRAACGRRRGRGGGRRRAAGRARRDQGCGAAHGAGHGKVYPPHQVSRDGRASPVPPPNLPPLTRPSVPRVGAVPPAKCVLRGRGTAARVWAGLTRGCLTRTTLPAWLRALLLRRLFGRFAQARSSKPVRMIGEGLSAAVSAVQAPLMKGMHRIKVRVAGEWDGRRLP